MKTSYIVGGLLSLVLLVMGIVAFNAFHVKREFIVLFNNKYGFCFLVDDRYQLKLTEKSFSYVAGKNSGEIEIKAGGLSDDLKRQNINGFEAGYKKAKNLRHFEYLLSGGFKLVDKFVHAQKSPPNLVPYREDCSKIKNNFKTHRKLF